MCGNCGIPSSSRRPFPTGENKARHFFVDVPEGKLLILQTVSFSAVVEAGQDARASVTFQGGEAQSTIHVPLDHQGTFGGRDYFVGTESATAYAANVATFEGLIVSAHRSSSSGIGGEIDFSVIGYLVDK